MQHTLTTLTQDLKDEIEDQGGSFAAFIPKMIQGAEDACIVDLDLEIFNVNVTSLFTAATPTLALPTGFLKMKSLARTLSGVVYLLEERTYEYCVDYGTTGAPLFWAPLDTTQVYIAPTPDLAYTATCRGPKRPSSLITVTTGTWLSLNCGDLLFKRSLIEAEKFNKADERLQMWRTEYQEELARKHLELRHLRNRNYDLGSVPQPQPQLVQEQ